MGRLLVRLNDPTEIGKPAARPAAANAKPFVMPEPTPDVVELLEAARTELDCGRLKGARLAISDYWAQRCHGNGTRETDAQAVELSRDIATHTPSDKSRSMRALLRPYAVAFVLPR
jgi:hypothetical protein